mgnify:CR=1 FL=1
MYLPLNASRAIAITTPTRRSGNLRRAAQALALMLLTPLASAHEFWLVPHDAVTGVDQQVVFELRIGPTWPGVQSPRLKNLVDWFKAVDAQGMRTVDGRDGALSVGHLHTRAPGATVVAMRTHPTRISLSASEFNQYLEDEGLKNVLALRKRYDLMQTQGREQYSRCAKSIVLVDGRSEGFDKVMDLPLEFVAHTDPLKFQSREKFQLQVLLHGEPLADTLVKAQLKSDPVKEVTVVSDAQGRVALPLTDPGLWLFSTVHMEPSGEDGVDWESLWASLTVNISFQDRSPLQ